MSLEASVDIQIHAGVGIIGVSCVVQVIQRALLIHAMDAFAFKHDGMLHREVRAGIQERHEEAAGKKQLTGKICKIKVREELVHFGVTATGMSSGTQAIKAMFDGADVSAFHTTEAEDIAVFPRIIE